MSDNPDFQIGERVVYPSHGVGEILEIETQIIADVTLDVYVIFFSQDKMTLRVPVSTASNAGLRKLITKTDLSTVYSILNSKPKTGNKMWSRRAQEYGTKIHSGQIDAVAEVVRDLYKNVDNNRSYSERTTYEQALKRLASEIAALEGISVLESTNRLIELLKEKLVAA